MSRGARAPSGSPGTDSGFASASGGSNAAIGESIFEAIHTGILSNVKRIVRQYGQTGKSKVYSLLNLKQNGTTPLLATCKSGFLDLVQYFVDELKADVEQVGTVQFEGEVIEGAPPLWCASAAGHLPIVQFLISRNAKVNGTTFTNSTPLRAACFDGHYAIVQYLVVNGADIEIANRHGHTCLMIACYKGHYDVAKYILEKGALVNRKSVKGNTALHDCAESGSLEIMKLLLKYNCKKQPDSYNVTPLMAASMTGYSNIVEYLIHRTDCKREDNINALELLGATYVDKKHDMLGAMTYWKMAMIERFYSGKGSKVMSKPLVKPVPAYNMASEADDMEKLEMLIGDPDEMRMQSLLIRERILGPQHPDTSYYIKYRGAVYADMGNFARCIELWRYALDMQRSTMEPLCQMTQSSFLSFAELFAFMLDEQHNHYAYDRVTTDELLYVLENAIDDFKKGMTAKVSSSAHSDKTEWKTYQTAIIIIMHLISLAAQLCVEERDMLKLKRLIYAFIKLNPRGKKDYSPLHLAVDGATSKAGRYPVCSFPCHKSAVLMLECGHDVNATDEDGNTALHIASINQTNKLDLIKLLMDNGAHIDICNKSHVSPIDILSETTFSSLSPINHLTLQCLAARVIVRNSIHYEGFVPKKVADFIVMH